MHIFYADESNMEPRLDDFFVYGGFCVSVDQAVGLHQEIENIRSHFKVVPDFLLKFNPGPSHLPHQDFINLKSAVIQTTIKHGCQMFLAFILRRIAVDIEYARRNEINRVLYMYHGFLSRIVDHGMVFIDRFNDKQIDDQLRERFAIGLRGMPHLDPCPLPNIVAVQYSVIGQSHYASICDILIGSFRHAVNVFTRNITAQMSNAQAILQSMNQLFPVANGAAITPNISFDPVNIIHQVYSKQYDDLKDYFRRNGISV